MTTYDFDYVTAGRNMGAKAWRDPSNSQYVYHLRERNELDLVSPTGFEMVKIDLATGTNTVLAFWDADDDYEELGACFNDPNSIDFNAGNLTGNSTHLYISAASGFGGSFDSVIIEFSKTTGEVTNSYATGTGESARRAGGVAVMSAAGTYYARAGDSNITATTFTTSYIELYRPSNEAYGRQQLSSIGISGLVGFHFFETSPICFDADGFLWIISQPWANGSGGRPDLQTAKSTLWKLQVQESLGVLSLTVVDSFEIDDDYYSFNTAGSGGTQSFSETFGYKRMVFDQNAEKIYIWSSWENSGASGDAIEGWFLEFDPDTETFTRGPLNWEGAVHQELAQHPDSVGFNADPVFATYLRRGSAASAVFNLFDIEEGTETEIEVQTNFAVTTNLREATLFHLSSGGSILYVMDVDFDNVGGFQLYRDGFFSALIEDEGDGLIGGSGMQLEPIGCVITAQPYALEVRDLNSILELGPFRFTEQKESDETSMVTTLVVGLSETDIGITVEIDLALVTNEEFVSTLFGDLVDPTDVTASVDYDTLVDILGDDIELDMGEGVGNSDDFTLHLLGNDDGSTYPGAPIEFKPEELDPIEDRGSTKQYSPLGYSFIYHRVRLSATEIDDKFSVKFVDISGQLTGRLL